MQDLFDFAKSYNLGVIQYAMMPDNIYPHSILDGRTTNWQAGQPFPTKLNALGNVWAANMRAA
jgi:hypothetical protein